MAKWVQTGGEVIDLGSLEDAIQLARDVLGGLSGVLRVVSVALDLIALLLLEAPNALEAIVSAAVFAIEQMILDILENNAAASLHLNTNWNPDWVYKRKAGDRASRTPDYFNDGALPLVGNGMNGWLLDIAASTTDPLDPFRPVTDAGTAVDLQAFERT